MIKFINDGGTSDLKNGLTDNYLLNCPLDRTSRTNDFGK